MAMFLSRIKKALNLGTKNITANGTYNASTDGYDGYSSVEVNVPQITPASITPSNATPAALTANSAVTPTANGYAIESYSEVEPAYNHDVSLSIGNIYKAALSGKFVPNVINITPTNASPVTLRYPYVYRNIAEYDGVAIAGFADKTPDDSNPPSISSGAIIKASASGYLYATQQAKFKAGTVTTSTSATTYVNVGFKPKFIGWVDYKDSTHLTLSIYNQDISTGATYRGAVNGSNMNCATFALPTSTGTSNAAKILSIDSTGFTVDKTSTAFGTTGYYFAVG